MGKAAKRLFCAEAYFRTDIQQSRYRLGVKGMRCRWGLRAAHNANILDRLAQQPACRVCAAGPRI